MLTYPPLAYAQAGHVTICGRGFLHVSEREVGGGA